MNRCPLGAVVLLGVLAACGPPPVQEGPATGRATTESRQAEGGESPNGLPARVDCPGVSGTIHLSLPAPHEDAELVVFAMSPESVTDSGAPSGPPLADVVVPLDPMQEGGLFPVPYRICTPERPLILMAALDAQGDREILGEGDYVGLVEVIVPDGAVVSADITLDRVRTAADAKKGDKPKDKTRRQRR